MSLSGASAYLSEVAGISDIKSLASKKNVQFDKWNNAIGSEFDLGKDGAFKDFKLLIGNFESQCDTTYVSSRCVVSTVVVLCGLIVWTDLLG